MLNPYLFEDCHRHKFSSCFPPTFEFWNSDSAIKMIIHQNSRIFSNPYVLSQIILMAKFMRKRISKLHFFRLSGKLKTAWKLVSVLKYVPKTLVSSWQQICWNRYLLYNPKYICNVCLIIYYLKATVAPAQLFFKQLLKQLWEE